MHVGMPISGGGGGGIPLPSDYLELVKDVPECVVFYNIPTYLLSGTFSRSAPPPRSVGKNNSPMGTLTEFGYYRGVRVLLK